MKTKPFENLVWVHVPYVYDEVFEAANAQYERLFFEYDISEADEDQFVRDYYEILVHRLLSEYTLPRSNSFLCTVDSKAVRNPQAAQERIDAMLRSYGFSESEAATFLAARWLRSLRVCEQQKLHFDQDRGRSKQIDC